MANNIKENFLKFIGVNEDIKDGDNLGHSDVNYSTTDKESFHDNRGGNNRRTLGSTDSTMTSRRANNPYSKVSDIQSESISRRETSAPVSSVSNSNYVKMVVFQPQTYEDTQTIIDNLRIGKPVIVNLETLNTDISQRVLDFVSGAIYALNGNIRKVSKGIFLLAPSGVDVAGNLTSDYASASKPKKGSFTTPRV